jgi:UDP-N-acetylglucosamine--N-acetylmuramyl-(pentapeptide) pyrophosphoryl-undecaprenol N-acetylglucosamine transferase
VLAKFARQVLVGFPQTFDGETLVGNPVRAQIGQIAPPAQRDFHHGGALRLLVLGGSQGARALNNAVPQAIAALGVPVEVLHQAGEKMLDDARKAYADAGVEARVEPFIADMAAAYAWADLVVCRAGALTLAELCAVGVGSVLVPFPQAVDDHQTRNAEYLVERGAALLLKQDDALASNLRGVLDELVRDPGRRFAMADAARSLARPDAADRVADAVLATINKEAA